MLLMLLLVLLCFRYVCNNAHIFYGNEELKYSISGETSFVIQSHRNDNNFQESLKFYSWNYSSETESAIHFEIPSIYSYSLNISLEITSINLLNNGLCGIKLPLNDYNILLKPNVNICNKADGILIYNNFTSKCNQNIQKNTIFNIIFDNHYFENSSYIFINDELIYEIPYILDSSFGFFCNNAIAFLYKFIYIIDNVNDNIFPIDKYTQIPQFTTDPDKSNSSQKTNHLWLYIFLPITCGLMIFGIVIYWFYFSKRKSIKSNYNVYYSNMSLQRKYTVSRTVDV